MEKVEIFLHGYPEELKQQIIREYQGGSSIEALRRKYNIKGKMTISRWLIKRGLKLSPSNVYIASSNERDLQPPKQLQEHSDKSSPELLLFQIAGLKRELLAAKLKADMLERMIELAEKDHNISIRKKSNTE
jgi:transposase-like protein